MALTNTCLRFLIWAKQQGVSFDSTLTLGHLDNLVSKEILLGLSEKHPGYINKELINWKEKYADPVFKALGASTVQSLDKSDYEQASIIHDLNLPFSASLHEKFSVIVDGGTLEHVFNFPVAIRSCMDALETGGHFIGFSPANNLMGHGFYQFSPELFYRIFSQKNNFRVKGLFLVAAPFTVDTKTWYEVTDPDLIKDRVTLNNRFPAFMMILAEKLGPGQFEKIYQSDYMQAWSNQGNLQASANPVKESKIRRIVKRLLGRNQDQEDLEKINPGYFRKKIFE